MNMKCIIGFHQWHGCKCSQCEKTRDEGHDWGKDCDKCSKCGATRQNAHKWNGCRCSSCGRTRDEGHDWDANCEKCARCGATRKDAHQWTGCRCTVCRVVRDEGHDWSKDCEKCPICGKTRTKSHDWGTDDKCAKCGVVKPNVQELFARGCSALLSENAAEAKRAFELAANAGSTDAKNMLGVLLVQTGGNLEIAYKWICEAADEGNATAIGNRGQVKYYMNPPGPGAMCRLEYSWGSEPPRGAPIGTVLEAPYRR